MATVTDITWLRAALNERIPNEGTEADTRFTDEELGALLDSNTNRLLAAAEGWLSKASMVMEERSISKYKIGDESYEYQAPRELHAYCIDMYNMYLKKGNGGSRMIKTGVKDSRIEFMTDASRIEGDPYSW